jgi:hypothetical protein
MTTPVGLPRTGARVPAAFTSRPDARKAHGTAGRIRTCSPSERRSARLSQPDGEQVRIRPKAVLEQPSSRGVGWYLLGRRNIVLSQRDELNPSAGTGSRLPERVRDARPLSPAPRHPRRPPRSREVPVTGRARRGRGEPVPLGISQHGAVDASSRFDGSPTVGVLCESGNDGGVRVAGTVPLVQPLVPCFGQRVPPRG